MNAKQVILNRLFKDSTVKRTFKEFSRTHPHYIRENKTEALRFISRLNDARRKGENLADVALPEYSSYYEIVSEEYVPKINKSIFQIGNVGNKDIKYYLKNETQRCSVEELTEKLSGFDVISFDIFDTLIYRKVGEPQDVFKIMAMEMGNYDFAKCRKSAESWTRANNYNLTGSREVVLSEIYDVLSKEYLIDRKWMEREIELELALAEPNPYMLEVYNNLLVQKKTIIITSDMYLPIDTIKQLLDKVGVHGYEAIYLSNEYRLTKGDGSLQAKLKEDYKNARIIHVGDSFEADYNMSVLSGIQAYHNPAPAMEYADYRDGSIANSFYHAIIGNEMNSGLWEKQKYYEHGFRVGGILTAGYCQFINSIVEKEKIDKVLFCARDCDVIFKAYTRYFNQCKSEYIYISRHAIMPIAGEYYFEDWISRFVLRYIEQMKGSRTIGDIFEECGIGYLIDDLEKENIDRYAFPIAYHHYTEMMIGFLKKKEEIIKATLERSLSGAKEYFRKVLEGCSRILVVDVGWSGTCISALKSFCEMQFPESGVCIKGALMCASRDETLAMRMECNDIYAYIYKKGQNVDLLNFMMPVGKPAKEQDYYHMPLEYLFTSTEPTLLSYENREEHSFSFKMNAPTNCSEIIKMQEGILDFADKFCSYTANIKVPAVISPYVAFMPLYKSIINKGYTYAIYKNFIYDAFSPVNNVQVGLFGNLFETNDDQNTSKKTSKAHEKHILFISPEMIYTGAPRSLLRMCKVAIEKGYKCTVWTAKGGPFADEYKKNNIPVLIVPEKNLSDPRIKKQLKSFDLAVCNTIVTDRYVVACSEYMPVVWYIREATNIPDFIRNNKEREFTLYNAESVYCVSEYAKKALEKYTKAKIHVIPNCVEDEAEMASGYVCGTGDKVKFVQFGTMEYRKGYDILAAAYNTMPKEYKDASELYFAGGFINSGTTFCSYLFSQIKDINGIHYLGTVKGEKNKIDTLSRMDVIVVASRDEACSLVALEGAMLSKPLILSSNVGAKYMIGDGNGYLFESGDVDELRQAMMKMIDNKESLQQMGDRSRKIYEKKAGMASYAESMETIFSLCQKKDIRHGSDNFSIKSRISYFEKKKKDNQIYAGMGEKVVVSLTSFPARMETLDICIQSLLNQTVKPHKVLLWLSKEQFPEGNKDLPEKLLRLKQNDIFEIHWVAGDLMPHKKYFYAAQKYQQYHIITVDDDVEYDPDMIMALLIGHSKYPHAICCHRANMIMFDENRQFRPYRYWQLENTTLLDTPTYRLLPTGIGGVLYPAGFFSKDLLNKEAIKDVCLRADDLWLKLFAVKKGYPAVLVSGYKIPENMEGTQREALFKKNVSGQNNQVLEDILHYFGNQGIDVNALVDRIYTDRFCKIK